MASASESELTAAQQLQVPGEGATANNPHRIQIDSEDESCEFDMDFADIKSLSSSVLEYEYENGRRYHSNRAGNYMMPNDEEEQDRMDLMAHVNERRTPQSSNKNSPQAHVIGNDISPIQPSWTLPNVEFIVENIEDAWLYKPNHFDFIHARLLAGSIADWPAFLKTIYTHIQPGGYFEIQESAVWAWSDDGSLKADSPLFQYVQALDAAGHAIGRELNIYYKLRDWLVETGFEDVQQYTYLLPYSPWPRDPYLKEIGKFQAAQVNQAVEAYGLRLLTQVLGWGG
ncbi:hypothetical protein N7526_000928 [Penicillium atrosanguineum]|nr:hypothetical protein N7526_000928 [Penicillium atrosanguineum]